MLRLTFVTFVIRYRMNGENTSTITVRATTCFGFRYAVMETKTSIMVVLRLLTVLFRIVVRSPSWKSSTSFLLLEERFVTFRSWMSVWLTTDWLTSRCLVILERCVSP